MSYVRYEDVAPFDFMGLQIREFNPAGLHSASVAEVTVLPGKKHETMSSTRSDKIYICTQGEVSFVVDNKEFLLRPKDVLLVAKGQWFNYRNDTPTTATVLVIHVPPFAMENERFLDQDQKGQ